MSRRISQKLPPEMSNPFCCLLCLEHTPMSNSCRTWGNRQTSILRVALAVKWCPDRTSVSGLAKNPVYHKSLWPSISTSIVKPCYRSRGTEPLSTWMPHAASFGALCHSKARFASVATPPFFSSFCSVLSGSSLNVSIVGVLMKDQTSNKEARLKWTVSYAW